MLKEEEEEVVKKEEEVRQQCVWHVLCAKSKEVRGDGRKARKRKRERHRDRENCLVLLG